MLGILSQRLQFGGTLSHWKSPIIFQIKQMFSPWISDAPVSVTSQPTVEELQDHAHLKLRKYMTQANDDVRFGRTMLLVAQLRNIEQKQIKEKFFPRFEGDFEELVKQSLEMSVSFDF